MLRQVLDDPKADLLDLYRAGMTGIKDSVRHKMKLFGSVGKA